MRVLACCVLVAAFACAGSTVARAGAWLWPENHGQVMLTTTFADAEKAYDSKGRLVATPPYRKFETQLYVEHGVADGLTFIGEGAAMDFSGAPETTIDLARSIAEAKAGSLISTERSPGLHYRGLGLGAAGARLRLACFGDYILSTQATVRAASSQAGRFLDSQIGFRSGGQNGPEARLDMTAGLRPLPDLLMMAQSFSAFAPRGGVAPVMAAQKFQLSAVYDVTPSISLQIGGVVAILGVNSPAERGVFSALWWRY